MGDSIFPSDELRRFSSAERALAKTFSLPQLESVERTIAEIKTSTEKTEALGKKLLAACQEKKTSLVGRQLKVLHTQKNPVARIKLLNTLIPYLSEEDVDAEVNDICTLLPASSQKTRIVAERYLSSLLFSQKHPVVLELDAKQPNSFAATIDTVKNSLLKSNSILPFLQQLNARQQAEVMSIATRRQL